ncbi:MAG: hypothetical protein ABI321_08985 [Polyangia bacterium]
MKKSAVLLTVGLVSVLGGCNLCGPEKVVQYEIAPAPTFAITNATGTTATTAAASTSFRMYLDSHGHFIGGVLSGGLDLILTLNNDAQSEFDINPDPLLEALDASGKNLRTADQALPAGTTFTLAPFSSEYANAMVTVTATVVDDPASPLTLSLHVEVAGSPSVVFDGMEPFMYLQSTYEQPGGCG